MATDLEKELQGSLNGYKKLGFKVADDITDRMLESVKLAIKRARDKSGKDVDPDGFKDSEEYFDLEMEGANLLADAFIEGFNQAWFHEVN